MPNLMIMSHQNNNKDLIVDEEKTSLSSASMNVCTGSSNRVFSEDNNYINTNEDISFYEDQNNIQQQYTLYSYEYNKNYKSWGANKKGDMMTNKEYMLCWEWFRETLRDVNKDDGEVLKTLAYYCVAHEIFEDHTQACKFFGNMFMTIENLVLSFTDLINVLTNSSNEHSVKLRNHIKNKQLRKKKKVKTHNVTVTSQSAATLTLLEESYSLPTLNTEHKTRHNIADPTPSHSSSSSSNRPRKSIRHGRRNQSMLAAKSSLPSISTSSCREPSQRKPSKASEKATDLSSIKVTTHRSTLSNAISAAVNSQLDPAHEVKPVGRLHTMGRMFRRQLSRLASRDDTKSSEALGTASASAPATATSLTTTNLDDSPFATATTETVHKVEPFESLKPLKPLKRVKKKVKKPKTEKKEKKHKKITETLEPEACDDDKPEQEQEQSEEKVGVLSNIGRTFRRQLSRLPSFSESKQRDTNT